MAKSNGKLKPRIKLRKVPKKQIDNPAELQPTKDGILRVTLENAPLSMVMLLNQIRDSGLRQEKYLAEMLKLMKE